MKFTFYDAVSSEQYYRNRVLTYLFIVYYFRICINIFPQIIGAV